jgi:hypothetical protein
MSPPRTTARALPRERWSHVGERIPERRAVFARLTARRDEEEVVSSQSSSVADIETA